MRICSVRLIVEAATVLVAGAALFTFDAHFAAIDALRVINRWAEVTQ